MPSAPNMVSPPYWAVLASPKKRNHSAPFNDTLIGNVIWANEMT